jgi:glyoxylase-like metal-dependent hydrolase (beta-lactamase superfamily II)
LIRIVRILAPNPGPYTLEGTNTWIVGGDPCLVVDPGPDDAEHVSTVAREAGRVAAIVLTHLHEDHAAGAASLSALTAAPVLGFDASAQADRLHDGTVLEVDGGDVRVLHTPGHSSDHICLWVEADRLLLTGDTVLGRGTSVVNPPDGDLGDYMRSLVRLERLGVATIYPGHGPAVFDASQRLRTYIDHRHERERQVLAALGDDFLSAEDVAAEIYPELDAMLRLAASRQVLAHLEKLEREGRVKRGENEGPAGFALTRSTRCTSCGRSAPPGAVLCSSCAVAALQQRPESDVGGPV